MKICIIGNSHVGALKRAWDGLSPRPAEVSLEFFAHRGRGMTQLVVDGNRLVAGNEALKSALRFTSGGQEWIKPDRYDLILLYGLGAKPFLGANAKGVSLQAKQSAAGDVARDSLLFGLIEKIRAITDLRIVIGHNPLPAAEEVKSRRPPTNYLEGIEFSNREIYQKMGASMIPQPPQTIVNGRFTDPVFTKGSKRLEVGDKRDGNLHPDEDAVHMNDDFGKVWLTEFFGYCAVVR